MAIDRNDYYKFIAGKFKKGNLKGRGVVETPTILISGWFVGNLYLVRGTLFDKRSKYCSSVNNLNLSLLLE